MKHPGSTIKRALTGLAAAGVVVGSAGWFPAHGGLFSGFGHDYQPRNVFTYPERLSLNLRRVALLPLTSDQDGAVLAAGCEALGPVLRNELIKVKRFEVVSVDAKTLREFTGRPAWAGTESLPPDFFDSLKKTYGCDAVMFCELTVFHAYPPLAVGWRLKLVDASTKQVIWAADEIFDDSDSSVARGAKHFAERQSAAEPAGWSVRHSPRMFGHYTAATLLACLPNR